MTPYTPIYAPPLRCRADLIELIAASPPRRGVLRALRDPLGCVRFWGGFSRLHPFKHPGWVVDVTSRHKTTWHVAVLAVDQPRPHYRIELIEEIPWRDWDTTREGAWSEGDHPFWARQWADKAVADEILRDANRGDGV